MDAKTERAELAPPPAEPPDRPDPEERRAHPSSMHQRLGWLHRRLSRFAFAHVHVDPRMADRVRTLAARGTVVYVMRHRSVADYLLVSAVLRREGLPLPRFANGVAIGWFRSLRWIAARIRSRLARGDLVAGRQREAEDRRAAARLVTEGRPILVFLRARAAGLRGAIRPRPTAEAARLGEPYLEDVLGVAREPGREVFVVPLAPFRGRGYRRREWRLTRILYSVRDAPNEAKKLVTFLFNRKDLSLTIGREVRLRELVDRYPRETEAALSRRLARILLLFLHREERVVWGPPLLPKREVREIVVGAPETRAAIERVARERGVAPATIEAEARADFDEMAASFEGVYFSLLAAVFHRIWNRMFGGLAITGLEGVAERMREHPVVLVPCHRSHFDYLVLSSIFHSNFLSPPHIAAGINLSFFPMGMLFRGAGAFFIRRTFGDDEIYKTVFRQYLSYLIREGYTQEFFIEGGRSRTGKILTPKLGMLGAIVDAFLAGTRRDLYFVPISITYDRLVEEEAYKRELLGERKERENLRALVRARSVLKSQYGTVHVDFAEPISLAAALGGLRERLAAAPDDPELEREKRRFVLKLGFRLLGEVNEVSVLGATPIAATVLLSSPRPAIRLEEFRRRARLLVAHAEREGVRFTSGLERDRETFAETVEFLVRAGLVRRLEDDAEGPILVVPEDKRINLDFYKNNAIHVFVVLALVAGAFARGVPASGLEEDVREWLELFRNEFVLPERGALARTIGVLVRGLAADGGAPEQAPLVGVSAGILANFYEAYAVVAGRVAALGEVGEAEEAGEAGEAGVEERELLARARRSYEAKLVLGELAKPEGNVTVTLENALRRYEEMGLVRLVEVGGRRLVRAGGGAGRVDELRRRLEAATASAR